MKDLTLKEAFENTKKYKRSAIISIVIMVIAVIVNAVIGMTVDSKFIVIPIVGVAVSVTVGVFIISSLADMKYHGIDIKELEWILKNENNLQVKTFVGDEVTVYTINGDNLKASASKADPTIYNSIKIQTPRGVVWAYDPSLVDDVINYKYEARIEYNANQGVITKMRVSKIAQ